MYQLIIQTDCGVGVVTEEEIHEFSKSKNPEAAAALKEIDFQLWEEENLNETVREDVCKLRKEKTLSGLEVYGYVLETQKGCLRQVEV
jgi:carbonic anhydrase